MEATINCTYSNGLKPPKETVTASPVVIAVLVTIGVDAFGNALTTASAGAGTVVVVADVWFDAGATVVAGAAVVEVGAVVAGAVVAGAVVTGAAVPLGACT